MTTKTFKTGDRVSLLASGARHMGASTGALATVGPKGMYGYYVDLIWDESPLRKGQCHGGYLPSEFKLVTPANTPIKAGDRVKCVRGTPGLSRYGSFGDLATVNKTGGNGTILNVTFDKDKRTVNVHADRFEKIEEAPKVEPKPAFKVGERVQTVAKLHGLACIVPVGSLGTVINGGSAAPRIEFDSGERWYAKPEAIVHTNLQKPVKSAPEPAKPDLKTALGGEFTGAYRVNKPIQKAWIIAVLSNDGTPRPAEKPSLYTSEAQAHAVAKSMAEKHTGETFMVFESTAVAAQPKTVSVELVRL